MCVPAVTQPGFVTPLPLSSERDLSSDKLHFGTCAWSFEDWHGSFYPVQLPAPERLAFYARFLDAVEIDSTFYAPPRATSAAHWLDATPEHFVFSAKMAREITHDRKLRGCSDLLAGFLASVAPLRSKLGCVLVQLPPYFTLGNDEQALRDFVRTLPSDFRFAIEFRDASWGLPRIAHLLEEHRVCWVWNDVTPLAQAVEGAFGYLPQTTDFLYVRLLGDLTTKYGGDGSRLHQYKGLLWPRDSSLDSWAARIQEHLPEAAKVLIYTNNHFEGFSPHTCQRLAERLGKTITLPTVAEISGETAEEGKQLSLL